MALLNFGDGAFGPEAPVGFFKDSQGRTWAPGDTFFGPTAPTGSYIDAEGRTIVPPPESYAPGIARGSSATAGGAVAPVAPSALGAMFAGWPKWLTYTLAGAALLLLMKKRR